MKTIGFLRFSELVSWLEQKLSWEAIDIWVFKVSEWAAVLTSHLG
jgi:hypothetical protein